MELVLENSQTEACKEIIANGHDVSIFQILKFNSNNNDIFTNTLCIIKISV